MHSHDHCQHHHGHSRAFIIGIILNSLFVLVEIIYGIAADSLALLADAGHNAGDVLALFLALGATLLAKRRPSERFTYGLQSASIIASLANAVLLMVAVGGIAWEALQRFADPSLPATGTVMAVAAVGVVINGLTAWMLHAGSEHDLNRRGAYLHMAADAGVSVGVIIAAFLMQLTGWLWLDPAVSLVIVYVIIIGSWQLLKDSLSLSLHAVPASVNAAEVKDYLTGLEGVSEVHDLHIWAMSTTQIAMSAHLRMPNGHPGDAFLKQLASAMREQFHIGHATFQIELGDMGDWHAGCDEDHAHHHH